MDEHVKEIIRAMGDDPEREGLLETPERVRKAWGAWGAGYRVADPGAVLKAFEDGAEGVSEMVTVLDIPVYSHCEHHLAPFFGVAHVAYIPDGRIVGLSKLSRLVDVFARRLQVQERLTTQVADTLHGALDPLGVGVMISCRHLCMESRGVRQRGARTVTTALRGVFMDDPAVRAEFLALCRATRP